MIDFLGLAEHNAKLEREDAEQERRERNEKYDDECDSNCRSCPEKFDCENSSYLLDDF